MKKQKILHIELRRKFEEIDFTPLTELPGNTISLASTVQYWDIIPKVKSYLEKSGKRVIVKKGAFYKGQVLGCNPVAFDKSADSLLLLADGKFHAINNSILLNAEIYVFNTKQLEKTERQEIERAKLRIKAKLKKFISSDIVGLLVSTKIGQSYKGYCEIKKKIEKQGKKVYVFESDSININELENFPQIKTFVNTACPGISYDDSRIVNLIDIIHYI